MREIELPPAHNKRADEMWDIIESSGVEFENKSVIDLGCGHGDMLWRVWRAGSEIALGIDSSDKFRGRASEVNNLIFAPYNIEKFIVEASTQTYDISMCLSVLPYIEKPSTVLRWMCDHSSVTLLEVQYAGDGPGFSHIQNDAHMYEWLHRIGWQRIDDIGRTHTRIRDAWRTIWKCE